MKLTSIVSALSALLLVIPNGYPSDTPPAKTHEEWRKELTLEPSTMAEFEELARQAREGGFPEVDIAAAALANAISAGDMEYLAKHYDALNKQIIAAPSESLPAEYAIFRYLALGLVKWHEGDKTAAEKAFKDAFWIEPNWADGIGQVVKRLRQEDALANLVMPMDEPIFEEAGRPRTLRDMIGKNRAVLLYLWADWCVACKKQLPGFALLASSGELKEIALAAVNVDPSTKAGAQKHLRGVSRTLAAYDETEKRALSQLLGRNFVPAAALISNEGKLLFFGSFADPQLETALDKLQSAR